MAEECAEDEATVGRSNDCWLGEVSSVICVSSVLCGIWLEKRRQITVKTYKKLCFFCYGDVVQMCTSAPPPLLWSPVDHREPQLPLFGIFTQHKNTQHVSSHEDITL